MGAPPHFIWPHSPEVYPPGKAKFDSLALYTERGASHTFGLAALAVIIPPRRRAAAGRSAIHPLLHHLPPAGLVPISPVFSTVLGELGPQLENAFLEYVIIQNGYYNGDTEMAISKRRDNIIQKLMNRINRTTRTHTRAQLHSLTRQTSAASHTPRPESSRERSNQ